jgi:cyclohexanecarboxyl-CoA dehydrogenase
MIDIALTPEQSAFQQSIRQFARKELAPTYLLRAKRDEFPWAEHRRVADLGVLGLLAGPVYGAGTDLDFVAVGLAFEELAYADFNVANCALPPIITSSILTQFASPEIQEQWVPGIVAGNHLVALGLTEPDSGSDAAAMRTAAVATGDGWVIDGEKTSVTSIQHAAAVIVFAKSETADGRKRVSAFLVPTDTPGVTVAPIPDTGWVPVGRGSVSFDGARVPANALIGGEGNGFRVIMREFDFTRPLLALTGIGTAQACLDETAAYVSERRAFGSLLSRFEGISFPLAEHLTKLHAARMICYDALRKRMLGVPHTAEAAMAKWFGPLVAGQAIHDALISHGHYGYSTESPFEQRLRDVLAVEIADGTAQVQKIVIAREAYGAAFVPYDKER